MAEVRATLSGAKAQDYPFSFNDIIAHTPGKKGRGDAKKGCYEHRNGKVLVVYSVNPQLVEIEKRANGKKTNRTGLTRTGMAIIGKNGSLRMVTCNREADGAKDWREYKGSFTIAGNPHVVAGPETAEIEGAGQVADDGEDAE